VHELTGIISEVVIAHGRAADCLAALIEEDQDISILILATSTAKDGPVHLVSLLAGPGAYAIPVAIAPGGLSGEAIDALA
jgi:hypothetical protein